MTRRLASLSLCLLAACAAERPSAPDAGIDARSEDDAGALPVLADVPCRIPLPADRTEGVDARCHDLRTHEDPRDVATPSVHVHVVVLEGTDPALVPVVVLDGGPGLRGRSYVPYLERARALARFGDRRVIFVEQRGVGASEPALSCGVREAMDVCVARARDAGITLERFGTAEAADDVADVVRALGHDDVMIAGGSYGSRLGQEVVRRHPTRVRALFLESLVPADEAYLAAFVRATGESLEALFAECRASPECASRYGELEGTLDEAFARARTEPLATVYGPLDERLATLAIVEAQYHQDHVATIPALLAAMARGDATAASALVTRALSRPPDVERLANQAVLCVDIAPVFSREGYDAALGEVPLALRATLASFAATLESCAALGIGAGDASARAPVRSETPAMLLTGALDSRTPVASAERVAVGMPRAQLVSLRGRVHTPALGLQHEDGPFDACASSILRRFLEAPDEPADTSCAQPVPLAWE